LAAKSRGLDNLEVYDELASATSLPLCVSERLMTRWGFREPLASGAAQIIMPDAAWRGGRSEAKEIATAARGAFGRDRVSDFRVNP
jgi:galactonate dehydratase